MTKSADCGFLTFRNWERRQTEEVELSIRNHGIFSNRVDGKRAVQEYAPICFVQAAALGTKLTSVYQAQSQIWQGPLSYDAARLSPCSFLGSAGRSFRRP
jgi:hypothetical protein